MRLHATTGDAAATTNVGDKDVFVAHLDQNGNITWRRQFGSAGEDKTYALTALGTGVAIIGIAGDSMPGQTEAGSGDAFVAALDGTGGLRWIKQIGSTG
jgi:hypothetical protein